MCVKAKRVALSSWVCGLGDGGVARPGHGHGCDHRISVRPKAFDALCVNLSTLNVLFPISVLSSGIADVLVCMPHSSHQIGSDQKNSRCPHIHCFFMRSAPVLRSL